MTNGFVGPYKSNLKKGVNFPDGDDEEDDLLITHSDTYDNVKTGKEYFILTVSDTAILTNGFRYIKELLLQTHHLQMFEAYHKTHQIQHPCIFWKKTDAFTIRASGFEKAERLLTCGEGLRS